MGVRKLLTYLEKYCRGACYEVSIEDIAEKYRKKFNCDPVIVVDGSCCLRAIYESSQLDWVCGGQYKEYYDKIKNFIEKFEAINIKLVIFFDGSTEESKREVWVMRRQQDLDRSSNLFNALEEGKTVQELSQEPFTLPCGVAETMCSAAKDLCYEVHYSLKDCDGEIASYAERNKCFAILSYDTDFIIHQNGAKYFLSGKDLNLNTMTTRVYNQKVLARRLQLTVSHLPLFASLVGNDFISADDLQPFHEKITGRNLYIPHLMKNVAQYVRSLEPRNFSISYLKSLSSDVFGSDCYGGDLKKSIMSYRKDMDKDDKLVGTGDKNWDNIVTFARNHYAVLESSPYLYTILSKKTFQLRPALENFKKFRPSADAMQLMRKHIYGVLLQECPQFSPSMSVEEWCVTKPESLAKASKISTSLPPEDSPKLLELWTNNERNFNKQKFKLLSWILSKHLYAHTDLSRYPQQLISAICILSYLCNDVELISDLEVRIFACVVVDVQAMNSRELSNLFVDRVDDRSIYLATLFSRAVPHLVLANSTCGHPIAAKWTKHPELFDGKLFQKFYLEKKTLPQKGNLNHYYQICDAVLSGNKDSLGQKGGEPRVPSKRPNRAPRAGGPAKQKTSTDWWSQQ